MSLLWLLICDLSNGMKGEDNGGSMVERGQDGKMGWDGKGKEMEGMMMTGWLPFKQSLDHGPCKSLQPWVCRELTDTTSPLPLHSSRDSLSIRAWRAREPEPEPKSQRAY